MKAQLFDVVHVTACTYHAPVTVAHHLMHLSPRPLPRQRRLSHEIELEPQPATMNRRLDYFGNDTTFATIEQTHRHLRVTSRSRVAVSPAFVPEPAETPAWEMVRQMCRTDRSQSALEASEFVHSSPMIRSDPAFTEFAVPSFQKGRPILEAVGDLTSRIHKSFQFDPTATTTTTPVLEALRLKRGVCQDFAHVQIACLRAMGLPSRYVSGYLETLPPPGKPKLAGADASHAWVSFFCPGIGWIDTDPTNDMFPSMQHITLGWGRDYGDVSPMRGVLVGSGGHTLHVTVDVIPLPESEPPVDETGE